MGILRVDSFRSTFGSSFERSKNICDRVMKGQERNWGGTLKVRKRFGLGMKSKLRFGKENRN